MNACEVCRDPECGPLVDVDGELVGEPCAEFFASERSLPRHLRDLGTHLLEDEPNRRHVAEVQLRQQPSDDDCDDLAAWHLVTP